MLCVRVRLVAITTATTKGRRRRRRKETGRALADPMEWRKFFPTNTKEEKRKETKQTNKQKEIQLHKQDTSPYI
jgi:hypothetical protein